MHNRKFVYVALAICVAALSAERCVLSGETSTQELRRCEQEAMWLEDEANGIVQRHRRGMPPSEFLSCPQVGY